MVCMMCILPDNAVQYSAVVFVLVKLIFVLANLPMFHDNREKLCRTWAGYLVRQWVEMLPSQQQPVHY